MACHHSCEASAIDVGVGGGPTVGAVATAVAMLAYVALGALARRLAPDAPPLLLSPPPAPARRQGLRAAALVCAATLALWWGAIAAFDLNPFFAKSPTDVAAALLTSLVAPLLDEAALALWVAQRRRRHGRT